LLLGKLTERTSLGPSAADGEFARLAWQGVGRRLQARSEALRVIRSYFAGQHFVEVETPVRVRTPGSDPNVRALRAEAGYLITSPEHHMKRLLVGGLPRIYQLAHASRSEELGALHEPEFSMLEWYRAFSDQEAVIADTEALVSAVVERVTGAPKLSVGGKQVEVRAPFERISVRQAFRRYAGVSDAVDLAETDATRFFELYVERVEPALTRRRRPIFLVEFPIAQAALARRSAGDARVVDRFELYVCGVELCNGYGELTDANEFVQRWRSERRAARAARRPSYPLDERLVAALREGMPASAGNALGVDRLVALACGEREIARVQAFPAARL
jgi:lysyl-tRNA synthetase class 2